MSYSVEITSYFKKQAKRLIKKYPSLKNDLTSMIASLEENPVQGTSIGQDCYKIRMPITSKNKGKSGGARLIINVQFTKEYVYLLSIYDKSEQGSMSDSDIRDILKHIPK